MASAPPLADFQPSPIENLDQLQLAAGTSAEAERPVAEVLAGNQEKHDRVRDRLIDRLNMSERAMSSLYGRWACNEQAMQAYIRLPDYEQKLKDMNNAGGPPQIISMVVPYIYASIEAMNTFLSAVLLTRRPIFPVDAGPKSQIENSRIMEQLLQYNCDHAGLQRSGYQFLMDSSIYGLGAMQNPYVNEYGMRTVVEDFLGTSSRTREERLIYSGNMPDNIDPYMFFPDPRVPMAEVAKRGDFVFWRKTCSFLDLKEYENAGVFHKVSRTKETPLPRFEGSAGELTRRNSRIGRDNWGSNLRGHERHGPASVEDFVQLDQGAVRLIPSEWGLGDSDRVEIWLFTLGNKNTILQAEPLDFDHGQRPVVATEPWAFGYEFGAMSAVDFLIPFQDAISWFVNSRIYNVRAVLNNQWIVDPQRINMSDLASPHPGKLIRLKKSFYGSDVRTAIQQLQIQDVTQTHVQDIRELQRLADGIFGINDNLRGLQASGGRKSATEARISAESGSSRLAHTARLISAEAMIPLAQQMCMNIQQYMPGEMAFNLVGEDGSRTPTSLDPSMVVGDFNFQVSDGTLPFDKIAMLDTWKEILMGVAQDPELRQQFSLSHIFEYVAELGGARNISSFKQQVPPPIQINQEIEDPEQIARDAQAGNIVPINLPRA